MKIKKHINEKCNEIKKEIEDKDPFGVGIDDDSEDSDAAAVKEIKVIPPGDDGYEDEEDL